MESTIKNDAAAWVKHFLPNPDREQMPEDYRAAYEEGATQVLRYLQQFAARVNANTPHFKATSFQDGQVDGALWAVDHISTLFGIE
jgi:hypothetical protein